MAGKQMDMYGFYTGSIFDAHEYLGAHVTAEGTVFRTFAPNAEKVSLLYGGTELPMNPVYNGQFYELTLSECRAGDTYEYRIYQKNGSYVDHCDPYGFQMELRPNHKSKVCDLTSYEFQDKKWMKRRSACLDRPMNIYEMHLGSWKKPGHEKGSEKLEETSIQSQRAKNDLEVSSREFREKNSEAVQWYQYDELAELLIPYLKESGYNYVEFLPVSEHPCDESWGYQNTGFFAPTSRYGAPEQLMKMIDLLHQNGIGVILDFVPVHFAIDAYGLAQYDGTALYEYPHSAVGVSEWGSYNFMHSRGEVRSFLQSAAHYWLSVYHFDGIRMDAISRIIYWQGDEKRGENGNAVDFIKVMNHGLRERNPGCILIAEDSTNYPKVTHPVDKGGLGFDYKWDMGWMHDTLEYFQLPPSKRSETYHKLTFSMMYFKHEKYLLALSHDEVVHGKATILQKMNGQYKEKFQQAKAMYLYMYLHPGKKLNFMGNEIGQLREWDEHREQDWDMRQYPTHDSFYRFMKELNHIYLSNDALYEDDYDENGFAWADCHQESRCIYAITRKSKKQEMLAVFNFSDRKWNKYFLSIEKPVKMLLNTEWEKYGGNVVGDQSVKAGKKGLFLDLEPFSGVLFEVEIV